MNSVHDIGDMTSIIKEHLGNSAIEDKWETKGDLLVDILQKSCYIRMFTALISNMIVSANFSSNISGHFHFPSLCVCQCRNVALECSLRAIQLSVKVN